MEITYKKGAANYKIGKPCSKWPFFNDFVQNFKEFFAEVARYRFSATHPYVKKRIDETTTISVDQSF